MKITAGKQLPDKKIMENLSLLYLLRNYQRNGYLKANVDPLGLEKTKQSGNVFESMKELYTLEYSNYGFSEKDLEKELLMYDSKNQVNNN